MSAPPLSLRSLSTLHWAVVFLSLVLTLTAWQVSSRIATEKAREQFDYQVEQLNELIRDRMRIYEFALMSGAGAIRAAGGEVDLPIWRNFSESLSLDERLPGINGIGVINRVAPDQLDGFLAEKQRERDYFRIHPSHDRQDFWPIVYIEPEVSNRAAVGLDMAHERNRYQAAMKAMSTGETQITGPIVLVQDAEQTPGFLFFYPFYDSVEPPPPGQREEQFRGLVYAPFIMSELMEGVLANVNRLVHFRIADGDSQLYSELENNPAGNVDATPMFAAEYSLDMYGRQWQFHIQTSQLFETFNDSKQPIVILIAGLVIDAFILLVFALMVNARRRAERKVEEKTSELRESLDFIRTLTDNLPLAVSVWDEGLTCRFMNAYGERWFPFTKEEAIGQPLSRFLGEDVVEQRRGYYDRVLAGDPVNATAAFPDMEGVIHDVVVSYYPVTLAGERCFMATTMDVTDVVQREKDLKVLNEELETQKEEAESAAKMKTAFLANMSHEIRTPMNAIIGVLVLLQEAGLEEHPRRLVRKAFSASEALLQLLNDILDLSKIEADRIDLDLQPFDIDMLVHRSVDMFAIAAEEKHLRLQVLIDPDTPNRVVGDLLRISQICTNLVGNAIKFTRVGGVVVRLGFEPSGSARGFLCIEVQDTGIGIREEDQQRIFDNFRQADESTSRNFGGTGLGLSISRRLTQLMDGEIDLESTLGKGATFRLKIPVGMASDARALGAAGHFQRVHVLHHGFDLHLTMLDEYQAHWGLQLEAVPDLSQWHRIMDRIAWAGDSEDIFLMIELDGADAGALAEFLEEVTAQPEQYPLWSVMIIVPAGYKGKWLAPFQLGGGRVSFEPLTPSRLHDHLSQRNRQKVEITASGRPCFEGISALVVDDVPLNCEIVVSYLRTFGVTAQSVQSGDEAIDVLRERSVDLVLMDLHLEGETGQEVAERIASLALDRAPVIAALSASISDIDRQTAKAAGMEDYLTKPVVPKDIQLLLETHFDDHKRAAAGPATNVDVGMTGSLPPFISPADFERQFGQDLELFERCVKSFVAGVSEMQLEAYGCTGADALERLAHKIKGAAAGIADTELAGQAAALEANPGDTSSQTMLMALIAMLDDHARRLEAQFVADAPVISESAGATELDESLERIKSRLIRNRIADDEDVQVILQHLSARGQSSQLARLRQSLEAYDFDQALAVVNEITVEG